MWIEQCVMDGVLDLVIALALGTLWFLVATIPGLDMKWEVLSAAVLGPACWYLLVTARVNLSS